MNKTKRGHVLSHSPDIPDARDFIFQPPGGTDLSVSTVIDLSPGLPAPFNQWTFQSCTANALATLYGFLQLKELKIAGLQAHEFDPIYYVAPSRMFIWYNGRSAVGYQGSNYGCFTRDAIKSMNQIGVCDEQRLPYFTENAYIKPSDQCYQDATKFKISSYMRLVKKDDMIQCLNSGFPFSVGISLYTLFDSDQVAQSGNVSIPDFTKEKFMGGHSIVVYGVDLVKKIWLCRNSWGTYWGMRGNFTLPLDYLDTTKVNLSFDAWTLRA